MAIHAALVSPPLARSDADAVESSATAAYSSTDTIEDILIGVAIAAFALDQRIDRKLLFDIARLLVEARTKGRSPELLTAAHEEAKRLPDWQCGICSETNPGTFDLCWNCSQTRELSTDCLSPQSEVLLAIDASASLEMK